MIGAVALGVSAAVAFAVGGQLGAGALGLVVKEPSPAIVTGATWGGRIAVFVAINMLIGGR